MVAENKPEHLWAIRLLKQYETVIFVRGGLTLVFIVLAVKSVFFK